MAEVTQTYTTTVKGSLGTLSPSAVTVEGDAAVQVETVVPADTTIDEVIAVDKDTVQGFYLWSNHDVTVTINSAVPLAILEANKPFWWDGVGTNPISESITALHIDNADLDVDAQFRAEFVVSAND